MASKEKTEKEKSLHAEIVGQMVTLATSGFGLVAALAWNSLIQEVVNDYVRKYLPDGNGVIPLLIYALAITALAVFVTYQLSKLARRLGIEAQKK